MPVTTSSGVPSVIEAGNNYNFTETFTDFPANAWSMQFVMNLAGSNVNANVFNATTVNTNSFQVNVSNLTTPGRYTFAEYVTETSSGQRTTAKTGVTQVIQDLTQPRVLTTAAATLAAARTALQQLASGQFQSVSVNNVSYTYATQSDLVSLITRLQAEVIREQQAEDVFRGVERTGRIGVRFK